MIEAVNTCPMPAQAQPAAAAAADGPEAAVAGNDFFAEVLAAVASGLSAVAASPLVSAGPLPEGAPAEGEVPAGEDAGGKPADSGSEAAVLAGSSMLPFMALCCATQEKPVQEEPAADAGTDKAVTKGGNKAAEAKGRAVKTPALPVEISSAQAVTVVPGQPADVAETDTAAQPAAKPASGAAVRVPGQPAVQEPGVQKTSAAAPVEKGRNAGGQTAAVTTETAKEAAPAVPADGAAAITASVQVQPQTDKDAAAAPVAADDTVPALKPAAAPAQKRGSARGENPGTEGGKAESGQNNPADAGLHAKGEMKTARFMEPGLQAACIKEESAAKLSRDEQKGVAPQAVTAGTVFEDHSSRRNTVESAGRTLPAATVNRLVEAATDLDVSGKRNVSFEINDRELGKMRVEMSMKGGEVNIRLNVDNAEAGRFISEKTSTLLDALSHHGVSGEVQVFSGDTAGQGAQERGQARHNPRFEPELPKSRVLEETAPEEKGRLNVYA